MAKGEREGSSLLLWPTHFWGWGYVLFKTVYEVANHPADVKLETVGVEDGAAYGWLAVALAPLLLD